MNHIENFLLDDDLAAAELHAANCPECREVLGDWKDISATAKTLRVTWESELRLPEEPSRFWRIAAAILLVASIGATSWYVVRKGSRDAAFDQQILRVTALDEVERAERAHLAAIDQLEKLTEAKLEDADTPLLLSYKEKLMLLDDAIAECRLSIDQNQQNAHLRKELLAIYSLKQRALQDVVREGTHAQ